MAKRFGDRWEVIESLGEGGQAHTFLVRDLNLSSPSDVRFVLKRLKNHERIDRFQREIEAVRKLHHPNIVEIIDADLQSQTPYLVTEYCIGGSLDKAAPFWHNSPLTAIELFQQVCEAVVYSHSNNIIHRDIKPGNVFLRSQMGPAVLGDFGLCYLQDYPDRLTHTQEAVGPRLFMAPELEDGRLDEVTPECDTYSLGKLLYWLLSSRGVFSREKHRDVKWDLKGQNPDRSLGWDNIYMEHVNRLLDLMIVADPSQRRGVANILILTRQKAKLVAKEYSPIAPGLHQPCIYCGQGIYNEQPSSVTAVRNFGIEPVGSAQWRILVCNTCGHVQLFRFDKASRKDWWGNAQ